MYLKVLISCVFVISFIPSNSQNLLKNIEEFEGGNSSPGNWSAVTDDLFIFQASNILESKFLYVSDGTEEGTIGLGPYLVDTDIVRLGDRAYFGGCNITYSADSCASLYVSDGTIDGTGIFFDLVPDGVSVGIDDIVAGDSLFYFSGFSLDHGFELYRSNGTVQGTYRVADINPGVQNGYSGELAVIDDVAYFAGYTIATGIEAWRSDGTESGTYMITDLNEGTANGFPSGFTKSGGYIYFAGLGTNTGFEVRRTTGEQGNVEIIGEGGGSTDSSIPSGFVDSDGVLYYAAEGNDAAGLDLFVYKHEGEPLHIDFETGDVFPRALMPFGDGEVIFNANDASGRELWRSDGTQAGTRKIIDLYPEEQDGVFGTGMVNESFYVYNDSLVYFAGADGVNAQGDFVFELFVTDGTEEGTRLVFDHVPGPEGSNPGEFFEFKNRIYYASTDPEVGREPFYLETGTTSSVQEVDREISMLRLPFPNPISKGGTLNMTVELDSGSSLNVGVFNVLGERVKDFYSLGYYGQGSHDIQMKVDNLPTGIYQFVLQGNQVASSFLIFVE